MIRCSDVSPPRGRPNSPRSKCAARRDAPCVRCVRGRRAPPLFRFVGAGPEEARGRKKKPALPYRALGQSAPNSESIFLRGTAAAPAVNSGGGPRATDLGSCAASGGPGATRSLCVRSAREWRTALSNFRNQSSGRRRLSCAAERSRMIAGPPADCANMRKAPSPDFVESTRGVAPSVRHGAAAGSSDCACGLFAPRAGASGAKEEGRH